MWPAWFLHTLTCHSVLFVREWELLTPKCVCTYNWVGAYLLFPPPPTRDSTWNGLFASIVLVSKLLNKLFLDKKVWSIQHLNTYSEIPLFIACVIQVIQSNMTGVLSKTNFDDQTAARGCSAHSIDPLQTSCDVRVSFWALSLKSVLWHHGMSAKDLVGVKKDLFLYQYADDYKIVKIW